MDQGVGVQDITHMSQGVTTILFPLTVVKTRQQAIEGTPPGIRGAAQIAKDILRYDGIRGLYRGFGTVVIGVIPARGVWDKCPIHDTDAC